MKGMGLGRRLKLYLLSFALLFVMIGNGSVVHAAKSDDGVRDFVTRLYKVCLDREPDAGGLNSWVQQLKEGKSGAEVAAGFFFSQEFIQRNLCNDCYVDSLYNCFLGREPDDAGKASWVKALKEGQTRGSVFNGFVGSAEFTAICKSYGIVRGNGDWSRNDMTATGVCSGCSNSNKKESADAPLSVFVTRLYQVCLGRTPDAGGLQTWVKALKSGSTGAEVASGFVFSQEFQNKNLCNEHFVEYMYQAFFGRSADPAGKADWVAVLDNGGTKGVVFSGFTGSAEFAALCSQYGIAPGGGDYGSNDFKAKGSCTEDVKALVQANQAIDNIENTEPQAQGSQEGQEPQQPQANQGSQEPQKPQENSASQDSQKPQTSQDDPVSPETQESQETQPHQHTYSVWTTVDAAICTKSGLEKRTCTTCQEEETRVINATGHHFGSWIVTKAATCKEEGIEIKICPACGEQQTRTLEMVTTHTYGLWSVEKPASCKESGIEVRSCSVCGHREERDIPMLTTHTFGEWVKLHDSTCSAPGCWAARCTVCGFYKFKYDPALPHTLRDLGDTPATCTTRGQHNSECTVCGQKFFSYTTQALGHRWDDDFTTDVAATCTKDGEKSIHCLNDGCTARKEITKISAYGAHVWGAATTELATCEKDGYTVRQCQVCGEEERKVVPALGHKWSAYTVTQLPNCVEDGKETRRCETCGKTEVRSYSAKLGGAHDMITVSAKAATCTEIGWKEYRKCNKCGYKEGYEEIPASGHTYDENVWYVYADWNCREGSFDDPHKEMNKNYQREGEVYREMDRCAPVVVKRECKKCNEGAELKMIPGTGHVWDDGGQGIGDKAYCTKCGLDTSRWTYTSGPSGDVGNPEIDQTTDRYRRVWGITYIVDQSKGEGIQGVYSYYLGSVTKTIIGKGDSQQLVTESPKAKPGYVFVGWRQLGVPNAQVEVPAGGVRYDSWRNLDKVYEAVFVPAGETVNLSEGDVPKGAGLDSLTGNGMLISTVPISAVLILAGSYGFYRMKRKK